MSSWSWSASVTGVPGDLDDQVAVADAGPRGRAVVLDGPDEDAVALRETDRAAEVPRDATRRDGDPEARPADGLAAAERVDAAASAASAGRAR